MAKAGLIALILGTVGAFLGGGVMLVSLLLPALTDGRTSWGEAMFGVIPGAAVMLFSLAVAAAGLAVLIVAKRKGKARP